MTDERCSAICPWCGKNCGLAIPHGEWHQCLCEESPSQWKKVEQPAPSPSETDRVKEWLLNHGNSWLEPFADLFDAYARQHTRGLERENATLRQIVKELAAKELYIGGFCELCAGYGVHTETCLIRRAQAIKP